MAEAGFRRLPGGASWLGLRLVWCPKYLRRILSGGFAVRCGELIEEIGTERGGQVVAKGVTPDPLHLFVPAAEFRHPGMRTTVVWSPAYVAALVGCVSESTVRRDIAHRWDVVG